MIATFDAIIESLRKGPNGNAFEKLFFEGDITSYPTPEDADRALCMMFASQATSEAHIDTLYQQSALYRPVFWKKDNYGIKLIQSVLEAVKNTTDTPYFVVTTGRGKNITERIHAPLLERWVREHVPYHMVMDDVNKSSMIYWYNNGVYQEIVENQFKGLIKREIERYRPDMVKVSIITEVYNLLMTDLEYVSMDSFNTDENLINFKNGILNLQTMELIPHSPKFMFTIQIPCDWTGVATPTPVFDSYMETLTGNKNDIISFLMQFIGISISNIRGERLKKALFLTGPGNTGKSQLKALVELLVGKQNHFAIDLAGIEKRFGTSYVYGKRIVGSADMGFMSISELMTFKQLTGGDSVMGEKKGQQGFSFIYHGLLWFCCNALPRFSGDTGTWVYNRICIVNCDNVIPEEKQDKELLGKMYTEASGIIFKAIHALKDVIANGYKFNEPQTVIEARKAYQRQNSFVAAFAEDCLVPYVPTNKSSCSTVTAVHMAFANWCRSNNNGHTLNSTEFKQQLAQHLNVDYRDLIEHASHGNIIRGYTLSDDANIYYL